MSNEWETVIPGSIPGGCELKRAIVPGGWIYRWDQRMVFVPVPAADAGITSGSGGVRVVPGSPAKEVLPSLHRFAGEMREPYRGEDVVVDARFGLPTRPKSIAEVLDAEFEEVSE